MHIYDINDLNVKYDFASKGIHDVHLNHLFNKTKVSYRCESALEE